MKYVPQRAALTLGTLGSSQSPSLVETLSISSKIRNCKIARAVLLSPFLRQLRRPPAPARGRARPKEDALAGARTGPHSSLPLPERAPEETSGE